MDCREASALVKDRIWPDFTAHFKSETTAASYQADISEIMRYCEKDFLEIDKKDVSVYFEYLQKKVKERKLAPATMAKKLRELHSFADYICLNREAYQIPDSFQDEYECYLQYAAKQESYTHSIPAEHMDRLLEAAQEDLMAYTILSLLLRVGLSSTEIIRLKAEDFGVFDNGVFVKVEGRQESCFVPEDVYEILKMYLSKKEDSLYLFSNTRGNPLNLMYISRMMKKFTKAAGIPSYSAENIRNTCGVAMFAYGADSGQVARQLGVTQIQIHRYKNFSYKDDLLRKAGSLVKIKIEPPKL